MLVRVLMVGDGLAGVALEDIAPEGGLLLERREVAAFWAAPGLRPFDLAIVAHSDLPADRAEAIRRLHSLPGKPEIAVLATALEDRETLRLLAAGCYAVVPTGQGEKQTVKALERLVSRRRDELAVAVRAEQAPSHLGVDDLLPRSPAAQSLLRIARRVAVSDTSLLLLGETGSGKEWLARALHAESRRSSGPFISINCGAIPESLLESELFGHEKGAFTGAVRTRRGYFERAHGGTLFLDEIGEMPPPLQVRLLHVLQAGRSSGWEARSR